MDNNEPNNIGSMRKITSAVKYLLILNIAIFLIEGWFGFPLSDLFSLKANWVRELAAGQLFTYMFVHANMSHLFMNMITLFFIGPTVERTLGSYRFFILYYLSGILGGLGWSLLAPEQSVCIGASGAVMGVLGAFGALYPNSTLLLWFILPVKTWLLVIGLAVWELTEMIGGDPKVGGVANAAHLVGGVAGFCYAFSLRRPDLLRKLKERLLGRSRRNSSRSSTKRSSSSARDISPEEMDCILEKIGKHGMGALTPREREMLRRATR